MKSFIARKRELQKLKEISELNRATLVVIKGRRRIGKSRLVEEFARDKVFLAFTGLAPAHGVTAQDRRDTFSRQLSQNVGIPPLSFTDWSDAFAHLSLHLTDRQTIILFDEISWMGAEDPTFLPKLKAWWDLILQKYPCVTLILCGSVSTWIEKNIIKSTAFFGRISLFLTLEELSLPECFTFLTEMGYNSSLYDTLKLLAVTGGVPWYLEQIVPYQMADENIKRLCFEKEGLLVHEFDRIFNDLFDTHGKIYKKIVYLLASGMKTLADIREELHYPLSGSLSAHLNMLTILGFVSRHPMWSLKTGCLGKQSLYRLRDNYLRFFIRYLSPNLPKIENATYVDLSLDALPGWSVMMSFQIESLLLNNRGLLLKAVGLHPSDVRMDNPYIQRATTRKKGCQIDYLVQTHTQNLFLFEFKFKRRERGTQIIESMREKIGRFSVPKGWGVVPVLVHVGGVSERVHEEQYFYRIIDLGDLLHQS